MEQGIERSKSNNLGVKKRLKLLISQGQDKLKENCSIFSGGEQFGGKKIL